MEALAVAGSVDTLEHRLEVADDAERQFVANAKQDCSRRRHGFVIPDQSGRGHHGSHRIGGKAHDDETDHGIRKILPTIQGKVTANSTSAARSRIPNPPGANATAASHSDPAMVTENRTAKTARLANMLFSAASACIMAGGLLAAGKVTASHSPAGGADYRL